jgi:trehalose 6-phosphate synthase/phosphatase
MKQRFPSQTENIVERALARERLVLLLDYDGTLVPLASMPDQAAPDRPLLELLAGLSSCPRTQVHIVSGRDEHTLARWFSELPLGLHAEHGLASRLEPRGPWQMIQEVSTEWREFASPILEDFAKRTPGALIEYKSSSMAWHFRAVEHELGISQSTALRVALTHALINSPMDVALGDKVVEIRPRGVHKGLVIEKFFSDMSHTVLLAFGDDRTDEDLFAALPNDGIAVHVGPNPSAAPFRLHDFRDVRDLLTQLVQRLTDRTNEKAL